MLGQAEVDRRFDHHPPTTPQKISAHQSARSSCKRLADALDELLPDGREKSLAFTALEECLMWANAAIARAVDHG